MADNLSSRLERQGESECDCFDKQPKARLKRYFGWKGALDLLAAAILLVPGLPMIGILVILIRLTSKGPGVYRQVRVGRDGHIYTMYKLRSMRSDAESKTGPVWTTIGSDSRITPLGYWLRKLHLDELPQLINVLKGEMSLIGPRPERPEFVHVLSQNIPGYRDRLRIAPGITGLAQINLPPDTDLNSVRRKLVLDLEYVEKASLTLDFRIFLCTLFRIFGVRGDRAMRIMSLQRTVVLEGVEKDGSESKAPAAPVTVAQVDPLLAAQEQPKVFRPQAGAAHQLEARHEVAGVAAHE
ncbi:sugar transferase [Anatilimnocola sp. NA78]|uniref:sugar transferase n=1 Tax=Anatilimnocola sp. NA78 TaxID=3415683 RepID=UPI003CE54852